MLVVTGERKVIGRKGMDIGAAKRIGESYAHLYGLRLTIIYL